MGKEVLLFDKVVVLLKRIGAPQNLNAVGPKIYTFAEKVYCLFLRAEWKCSFRETVKKCKRLGISCQSKSTLQYTLNRIPWQSIKNMLKATITRQTHLAAIDGSTLSRHRLSDHYVLRSGIKVRERPTTKISIMIDTKTKKILSARCRKHQAHDIKDVKYLLKETPVKPTKIVADKGYDAEWFREFLAEQGIDCCIPIRGKVTKGYHRKRYKHDQRIYKRRPLVESAFFRLKQLFGRSVDCLTARTMRAEVFIRIILYNLDSMFIMI